MTNFQDNQQFLQTLASQPDFKSSKYTLTTSSNTSQNKMPEADSLHHTRHNEFSAALLSLFLLFQGSSVDLSQICDNLNRISRDQYGTKKGCHTCGQLGHFAKNCPQNAQASRQAGRIMAPVFASPAAAGPNAAMLFGPGSPLLAPGWNLAPVTEDE